jgi:hypothetical protein
VRSRPSARILVWCAILSPARAASDRYEQFLVWLLTGVGLGQEVALQLAGDAQNQGWEARQDALRAFLRAHDQDVAHLLAAGAKHIAKLEKYQDMTDITRVNLPSGSITLQSLKPSCRWELRMTLRRADTVPAAAFVVTSIAFGRWSTRPRCNVRRTSSS